MIDHMFFVPIIHLQVDNWLYKKKKLLNIYDQVAEEREILGGNITTNFFKNSFKIKNDIRYIFYDEIEKFSRLFSCEQWTIKNAWFELAKKNSFHSIHNHGAIGYSSVCYINYNKSEHTATKFIAPFLNFLDGNQIDYNPENIKEGSIIFFPSSILHYTDPNVSDEERLIISFNLDVK